MKFNRLETTNHSFYLLVLWLGLWLAMPGLSQARGVVAPGLLSEISKAKSAAAKGVAQTPTGLIRTTPTGFWMLYAQYDPKLTAPATLKPMLQAAGAVGLTDCLTLNLVQLWVKPGQIEALAAVPGVKFIGLARNGTRRTGVVDTEGDTVLRAKKARQNYGVTGKGVRVGVISDGVVNQAAPKMTGDVPEDLYVRPEVIEITRTEQVYDELLSQTIIVTSGTQPDVSTYTLVTTSVISKVVVTTSAVVLEGGVGTGDEGTAMVEIVHDLAPGATVGFAPGLNSDVEFINAVADLADNFKANIIVDDIGFYLEPVYEAGPIALACQQTVKFKGVNYFTAAGNDATTNYESIFHASTTTPYPAGHVGPAHDFGNGDRFMDLGQMARYSTIAVFLQWNDPYNAPTSEFKLHLYDKTNTRTPVASSDNFSKYYFDHKVAGELLYYEVPPTVGYYQDLMMSVEKVSGPATQFSLMRLPDGHEYTTGQGANSIFGHAGIPEVNSVGAVNEAAPNSLEYFSSQGPSTVFFPFYVNRSKPDFVATDGVSITGAGGFSNPFYGTSAAAPHAAAVGALVLERNPKLTPAELQAILQQTAVPLLGSSYNYKAGFGRVDAFNAVAGTTKNSTDGWSMYE
jgi:subtilisin family serine protease